MKKILLLVTLLLSTILCFSQNSQAADSVRRDTLSYRRTFLFTKVYKNGTQIKGAYLKSFVRTYSEADTKYTWGKVLQPVGPVLTIGGIVLMANGLRGVDKSAIIDGVNYNYTQRSLSKTLLGLASTALGLCLIESSNELITHSVNIYNNAILNRKAKISYKAGITPEGNVGLVMNF